MVNTATLPGLPGLLIFGPLGLPGLQIPTTLMLDAKGVVCWKDQSEDYMQRSNPEHVRAALTQHFQMTSR